MKRYLTIPILFLLLITSCSLNTTQKRSDKNIAFYVQTDKDAQETYKTNNSDWSLKAEIKNKTEKPKIFIYNFIINSKTEKFTVSDIDFKYGSYGKWRMIEKKKHLAFYNNPENTVVLNELPITIKKTGEPHNQLLRLTIKTDKGSTRYINLIFGIQKCLSKTEKEFVCF